MTRPRLPNPIAEHPVESLVAGLLLVALLFVSGGESANSAQAAVRSSAQLEKM